MRMKGSNKGGAMDGVLWIAHRAESWAAEGRSAAEIAAMIGDLASVLSDWHEGLVDLPDGEPWRWSHSDLDHVIAMRKSEWV